MLTVDQEVGGSNPPGRTSKINLECLGAWRLGPGCAPAERLPVHSTVNDCLGRQQLPSTPLGGGFRRAPGGEFQGLVVHWTEAQADQIP
jgi:hypothetical protein